MGHLKETIKAFLKVGVPVNAFTKPLFSVIYKVHFVVNESLIVLLRFFYFEPLFKSQCSSVGKGFWMEQLPYMSNSGDINIGENVRFSGQPSFGFSRAFTESPSVVIGSDTFIGHLVAFNVGKSVVIGRNCFIAGGVRISDNDGHPLNFMDRRNHLPPAKQDFKEVRIGNDVWVGANALILKGVTIGDRAIVGANAVVTKDVLPDTIVAGNPARVIKELSQ